jgi:hypothetical protein
MIDFYFPDSIDVINPSYNFEEEEHDRGRIRIQSEVYPHQVCDRAPYDGMLVSMAIVNGRYTLAQRQRLKRQGIRKFLRLDSEKHQSIKTLGDCGAFSYRNDPEPPYTVDEVIEFYKSLGFDYGIALDLIIFAFEEDNEEEFLLFEDDKRKAELEAWKKRQEKNLLLAQEFITKVKKKKPGFHPIGVAHGWSPGSYANAFQALQKMGYNYIALGGLVPLKSEQIESCLKKISKIRRKNTRIHLLGISRIEGIASFQKYGVTSADSTAPFIQAFKSDTHNYHTLDRTYIALRVPQGEGNAKLRERILSGQIRQEVARKMEINCMKLLKDFQDGQSSIEEVADALCHYEALVTNKKPKKRDLYVKTLEDRPWENCNCPICKEIGIHVIIFRGAERNRRRGFHNLYNYYDLLKS